MIRFKNPQFANSAKIYYSKWVTGSIENCKVDWSTCTVLIFIFVFGDNIKACQFKNSNHICIQL